MRICSFGLRSLWSSFAVLAVAVVAGCTSPPGTTGGTPVPGWSGCRDVTSGIPDTNGDGIPDGVEIVIRPGNNVGACNVAGDDVAIMITTERKAGVDSYKIVVTDGPLTDTEYFPEDFIDAISIMDQILVGSGYDLSQPGTDAYRAATKTWIISNWMDADDFHNTFGV